MRRTSLPPPLRARSTGAAALLVAVFILLTVTVMVVFTANTAFMEQRMAANEVRAKQAAAAAQTALETAVAYLQQGGNDPSALPCDPDVGEDQPPYRCRFWAPAMDHPETDVASDPGAERPPPCPAHWDAAPFNHTDFTPGDTRHVLIYACGWSDDLSARSLAKMEVLAGPSLGGQPNAPFVSRGSANTYGNARVYNLFHDLTIWSGGALEVAGNPGNTFTRNPEFNPSDGREPDLENLPAQCGSQQANDPEREYICRTSMHMGTGGDVIPDDPTLGSLTPEQFFEYFMGLPKDEYKADIATELSKDDVDKLPEMGGQVVWIDGEGGAVSLSDDIGTRENPLVLVIDGDLRSTGNIQFFGVLYVTGNLSQVHGTPMFFGSMIIEGVTESFSGNPSIIYDPLALAGAGSQGRRVGMYGTWRDWSLPDADNSGT
ncbi:pilus assembly PilX family protein [Thioalkalivibrio paradoxus]|uniref:Type 4 fimbrial biogenesis protein PilX N-terminal domain-containing protein n=1 Tax=Thioalkalivibrio paradoxus ARh 1 TaxID=713585 RepID=W0DRI5_9GAMM|nr:pilus assembly PilX N-terminal domain-containing protein [Thioalkalivibrio paradoxus]AHE99872.1 hypothetical protein THITH_02265 [Thioalkalivibrio paradoxus ARh 1]